MTKDQLELQVLQAQHEKLLAESKILRRTTPVSEFAKIIGSLIVSVGALVAGVNAYQIGKMEALLNKAEAIKAKNEKRDAEDGKKSAESEIRKLEDEKKYLETVLVDKKTLLGDIQIQIETLTITFANLQKCTVSSENNAVKVADSLLGQADIDLRASLPVVQNPKSSQSMTHLVESLFGSSASVRGSAYNDLMASYSEDPKIVPVDFPAFTRHFRASEKTPLHI
jgi:hypothetical protein